MATSSNKKFIMNPKWRIVVNEGIRAGRVDKPILPGQSSSGVKYPFQSMASIEFSDQQSQTQRPQFPMLAVS